MKVALCIPAYGDTVKTGFADCLTGLALYAGAVPFNGERLSVQRFFGRGLLPQSRNMAANKALLWGADWMLWLDSDQTFPPDTLHRLLAHGQKIVGANILSRGRPGGTAARWKGDTFETFETTAEMARTTPLEPVYILGLGVVLIASEVITAVAKFSGGLPFHFERHQTGEWVGEDYPFFDKAKRCGFSAYVDHTLSMEVGHLAETELRFGR